MKSKKLAIAIIVALCIAPISGCVSGKFQPRTWMKTKFCSVDFDKVEAQLKQEAAFVDGIYWHYVNLLKSGDATALPIVVSMDLFLKVAKPVLQGMQQGLCPPEPVVDEAVVSADEVRARVETNEATKMTFRLY